MSDATDRFFAEYISRYLSGNRAAGIIKSALDDAGVGLMPLVDHCALRTHDVDKRAEQVVELGFVHDDSIGILEFDNWWAKVYRKEGYPALFIDQAYSSERGKNSLIPEWVDAHGDQGFHHFAIRVEDIESAIDKMKRKGVEFAGEIVGDRGTDLRQIFTRPEVLNGKVFSVLELIERRNGYTGFLPPQADGLMESTRDTPG